MDSRCQWGMISTRGWKPWVIKLVLCSNIYAKASMVRIKHVFFLYTKVHHRKVRWGLQGSPNWRHWHPPFKKGRGGRNWRQMYTRFQWTWKWPYLLWDKEEASRRVFLKVSGHQPYQTWSHPSSHQNCKMINPCRRRCSVCGTLSWQ